MKRGIGKAAAMAMKKKKKKKRTIRGNYNSSSGDGESGEVYSAAAQVVLPHDLVAEELLTRLPAKSLMRFKCVSKLWLSTIVDPAFCKAHRRARSCVTRLLIVSPDDDEEEEHQGLGFFLATPSSLPPLDNRDDVFDSLQFHHQFTLYTANHQYDGVSEVDAEGGNLLCLYTASRAWLYSVSTEIQGALFLSLRFTILTLGGEEEEEASCRKLNRGGVSPILLVGRGNNHNSVYINGALYWWHYSGCLLLRCCFQDEEFQKMKLPPGFPELGGSLHEFRGHLALVTGVMDQKLHMWLICCNCDDEEVWSERTFHIPYAVADRGCCLLRNLHTGLTLMTGTIEDQPPPPPKLEEVEVYDSKSPLKATPPIYSYDLLFTKFDESVIGNLFSSTSLVGKDASKVRTYNYAEDIRPLNLFISNPFGK